MRDSSSWGDHGLGGLEAVVKRGRRLSSCSLATSRLRHQEPNRRATASEHRERGSPTSGHRHHRHAYVPLGGGADSPRHSSRLLAILLGALDDLMRKSHTTRPWVIGPDREAITMRTGRGSLIRVKVCLVAIGLSMGLVCGGALAAGAPSHATNFKTRGGVVVCGIALVPGSRFDPGTQSTLSGRWPGLQCSAPGIPRSSTGVGDPFVQLGEGQTGRARVVDLSQNDLLYDRAPVALAAGRTWALDGISCSIGAGSIACQNSGGHGFTLAAGHLTRR
jgi:hypothetical protein